MKVMILGANGQLGAALLAACPARHHCIVMERSQLDLENAASIMPVISRFRPEVIINAAAYTAVDKAESEPERAHAINAEAVGEIAKAAAALGARLIHVSTDFVFDGTRGTPYPTDAEPNPINVYGASKLAGERLVQDIEGLNWLILRTAWVYAAQGRNFLNTMLRLMTEREHIDVVTDQVGTPTAAHSLASVLWAAVEQPDFSGIRHWTDAGVASWYDFAVAIREEARAMGILRRDIDIRPIGTDAFPTAARRPAYSVLDKRDSWNALTITPVHWRENLRKTLRELRT